MICKHLHFNVIKVCVFFWILYCVIIHNTCIQMLSSVSHRSLIDWTYHCYLSSCPLQSFPAWECRNGHRLRLVLLFLLSLATTDKLRSVLLECFLCIAVSKPHSEQTGLCYSNSRTILIIGSWQNNFIFPWIGKRFQSQH